MTDSLVTVATFGNSVEANLARNYLEAAGVRCVLTSEDTAGIVWQFTSAVGGIQLLVSSEDIDAARRALEDHLADQGPPPPVPATGVMTEADHRFDAEPEVEDEEPTFTTRELDAKRALTAAVLGLLCFPIQLYASYLLVKTYLSDQPIRPGCVWQAVLAWVLNLLGWMLGTVFLGALLG